jgi:hypothetical protein
MLKSESTGKAPYINENANQGKEVKMLHSVLTKNKLTIGDFEDFEDSSGS